MAYKKFKITVTEKGAVDKEEAIQEIVYISAVQKAKAERIAILIVADEFRYKTSDLEVTNNEQMKKSDTLDWKEFVPVVGVQKAEFGARDVEC